MTTNGTRPAFQIEYTSLTDGTIMLAGRALADITVGDILWWTSSGGESGYTVTRIEMYGRPMDFVDAGMTAAVYVIGEPMSIPDHTTLDLVPSSHSVTRLAGFFGTYDGPPATVEQMNELVPRRWESSDN